jgi:hypothetical protein
MTNRASIVFLGCIAVLTLLFTGCKSTPKADWASRVGNYTYDQAVSELGPPDKEATLTDGKLVADWITGRRRSGASVGLGMGSYGHSGGVGVGMSHGIGPGSRDQVLRLTFGPDKKLVNYVKNY